MHGRPCRPHRRTHAVTRRGAGCRPPATLRYGADVRQRPVGWLAPVRGAVLAALITLLTATGHVVGGGTVVSLSPLAVLVPLLATVLVALAERCRGIVATLLTLGAGQLALHRPAVAGAHQQGERERRGDPAHDPARPPAHQAGGSVHPHPVPDGPFADEGPTGPRAIVAGPRGCTPLGHGAAVPAAARRRVTGT